MRAVVPDSRTSPDLGGKSPEIRRKSVLLPAPLRPTIPVRSRAKLSVRSVKSGVPSGVDHDRAEREIESGLEGMGQNFSQQNRRGESGGVLVHVEVSPFSIAQN